MKRLLLLAAALVTPALAQSPPPADRPTPTPAAERQPAMGGPFEPVLLTERGDLVTGNWPMPSVGAYPACARGRTDRCAQRIERLAARSR